MSDQSTPRYSSTSSTCLSDSTETDKRKSQALSFAKEIGSSPLSQADKRTSALSNDDQRRLSYSFNQPAENIQINVVNTIEKRESIYSTTKVYRGKGRKGGLSKLCCNFCCFKSKKGAIISIIVTLVLLLGIALTTFFLYPRAPSVNYQNILQTDNKPLSQTGFNQLFSKGSEGLEAKAKLNLRINNPNFIGLSVSQVSFSGSLNAGSVQISQFIQGQLTQPQLINSRTATNLTIPIQISIPGFSSQSSTTIAGLKVVCSSGGILEIPYTMTLDMALISWTGFKPTIKDTFSLPCPWLIP